MILQHNDHVKGPCSCLLRVQVLQKAVERVCLGAQRAAHSKRGRQCRA